MIKGNAVMPREGTPIRMVLSFFSCPQAWEEKPSSKIKLKQQSFLIFILFSLSYFLTAKVIEESVLEAPMPPAL